MTRKPRTLRRRLAAALLIPACAAAGFSIGATFTPLQAPAATSGPAPDRLAWQDRADRLTERLACEPGAVPQGVIPEHALLLLEDRLHVVDFGRGWAAYEGTQPGTLVAVCAR